jgi:hypothetical protein
MASIINASTSGAGGVITTADASGQLELQTAGVTRQTIDVNGNVGIGTSSPGEKLTISGNQNFSTSSYLYSSAGGSGVRSGFLLDGTNAAIMSFTNGSERMRIDTSGNLLVGTTSTISATAGAIQVKFQGDTVRNGIGLMTTETTGYMASFYNSSAVLSGFIYYNGSATSYSTSSDYRLKENIAPMTGALDVVQALKPVTYKWKVDGSDGQGFIAHELQEVVPDCVTGEKDAVEIVDEFDEDGKKIGTKEVPRYQGIDTSFLVATLTAAIQEQQAIITDLKARIEVLEGASA